MRVATGMILACLFSRADGRPEGRTDSRMAKLTDGRSEGPTNGRKDGRTDGRTDDNLLERIGCNLEKTFVTAM